MRELTRSPGDDQGGAMPQNVARPEGPTFVKVQLFCDT